MIVDCGGLPPLIEMLSSEFVDCQHFAARALYRLASGESPRALSAPSTTARRLIACRTKQAGMRTRWVT